MPQKLLAVATFAWLLVAALIGHTETIGQPAGGTLVVSVPCKHGIVVAADTRINGKKKSIDGFRKLRPLGNHGVFAITMRTAHTDSEDISLREPFKFDFHQKVEDYYSDRDVRAIGDDLPQVEQQLSSLYAPFFNVDGPDVPKADEGKFFQMVVVTSNRQGDVEAYLFIGREVTKPRRRCEVKATRLREPKLFGRTEVAEEIMRGSRKEFDKWRNSDAVKKMSLGTPSKNDAVAFARIIIKATNKMMGHLNLRTTVGPHVDCALVRSDRVDWISITSKRAGANPNE